MRKRFQYWKNKEFKREAIRKHPKKPFSNQKPAAKGLLGNPKRRSAAFARVGVSQKK
jgi:hypothetical protein